VNPSRFSRYNAVREIIIILFVASIDFSLPQPLVFFMRPLDCIDIHDPDTVLERRPGLIILSFGGSGFWNGAGGYLQAVVKSPQFRLVLAKGADQDRGRSPKIVNYNSFFLRYRIIRALRRKWRIYEPEKLP